jgi:hypothetical protein
VTPRKARPRAILCQLLTPLCFRLVGLADARQALTCWVARWSVTHLGTSCSAWLCAHILSYPDQPNLSLLHWSSTHNSHTRPPPSPPPPPQALQSLALDPVFLSTLNTWLADLVVERSDANLHVLKQVLQLLGLLKAATWAGVTASGLCVTVRKAVGHRNRDVVATATALIKVGIRVHGGWGQEGRHCAQTGSLQQTWAGGHMCASIYAVVFVPACVCPGLPARACWFVGRCCLLSHPPLCCCMWLL